MDADDKQTARKVWKWDKNGLSYGKGGINGANGSPESLEIIDSIFAGAYYTLLDRVNLLNLKLKSAK